MQRRGFRYAFKLTTARLPSDGELAVLQRIYDKQLAKYQKIWGCKR